MKKSIILYTLGVVLTMTLPACVRNTLQDEVPEGIAALAIPEQFDWSSMAPVSIQVIPDDAYQGKYHYTVEVYATNPIHDTAAVLLAKGVAKGFLPYERQLELPTALQRVYVRQLDPQKQQRVQAAAIQDGRIVCDFTSVQTESALSTFALRAASTVEADPTPASAIQLSSNPQTDIRLSANTAYLIPEGTTYTGRISFDSGASLYVEGVLDVGSDRLFQMQSNCKVVVQEQGLLRASENSTFQFWTGHLKNFGLVELGSIHLTSSALFTNMGIARLAGELSITDRSIQVQNGGVFSVLQARLTNGEVHNWGEWTTINQLYLNGASLITDGAMIAGQLESVNANVRINCGLHVLNEMQDNGSQYFIASGALFEVKRILAGGSRIQFDAQAWLLAEEVVFSPYASTFEGVGEGFGLATLGAVRPSNSGNSTMGYYKGLIEIECSQHEVGKKGNFVIPESMVLFSAQGESKTVIPASHCNNDGNVVLPPVEEPEDPTFPIDVPPSGSYTFIMEDNWPSLGDYDMNDLVVSLRIGYRINELNQVLEMTMETSLRAVGAKLRLGAAFQLDEVTPALIEQVEYQEDYLTGGVFKLDSKGCELDQQLAVIPLFDDVHTVLDSSMTGETTMINTFAHEPYFQPKDNRIRIRFTEPVAADRLSIAKLNFFIVSDPKPDAEIRTEIHLSGYQPTDKMNTFLFGKRNDNSIHASYYTSPGNLIWGLLVPSQFDYSAEFKSITEAYPEFTRWCTSGGLEASDWYTLPTELPGVLYNK